MKPSGLLKALLPFPALIGMATALGFLNLLLPFLFVRMLRLIFTDIFTHKM